MPHHVVCPTCGSRLPVDDTLAGKRIRCGGCSAVIDVPCPAPKASPATPAQPPSQADPNTTVVICTCRARFTVPTSARGTKQRCPTCRNLVLVPADPSHGPSFANLGAVQVSSPLPSSPPAQNPYRRIQSNAKPKSNKPIVLTAILGFAALLLLVGGTLAIDFVIRYRQTKTATETKAERESIDEDTDAPKLSVEDLINIQPSQSIEPSTEYLKPIEPMESQAPKEPAIAETATPDRPPPATSIPIPKRDLPPADETGLSRIHFPEGYSIALPPGFTAQPRAINRMTAIYTAQWRDGTTLTFTVTDNNSITADTPIPTVAQSVSLDGKQTIRPVSMSGEQGMSDTFKIDGMNASFAELEQDISHGDMTEQLQFMFSGAMTPEKKRQYAHLMQEKTAFRAAMIMKAMDEKKTLEVAIAAVRDKPFRAPPSWLNMLRTTRHEIPPNPSKVPPPFEKRR